MQKSNTSFVMDKFVTVGPGEPYRLFPFGPIFKGGEMHDITPDSAAKFRLPHFKPPILLGSHEETTPAGGHIIGLEVRSDGLYALTELNEKGTQAMQDGAYRYHSPEVIWDGYGLEDPTNGALIEGPLIVGDALLHTPHLGEAAALYTTEPHMKEINQMAENVIQVPETLFGKFAAFLGAPAPKADPQPEPKSEPKGVEAEKFEAVKKERDEFEAKLLEIQAKSKHEAEVTKLTAELQAKDEKGKELFGMSYVELGKAQEAAEMLAGMSPEQREWCMRNFKAYAAQIDYTARKAKGSEGASDEDPKDAFGAAIKAEMTADAKLDYNAAVGAVTRKNPELAAQYAASLRGR
jgi:hypothetical protein